MKYFTRFAAVGALGTVTNLLLFYVFVDLLGLPPIPIAIVSYVLAATQNYFVNNFWTFERSIGTPSKHASRLLKFILASTVGLVINLIVLKTTIDWFNKAVFSQLLGITAGLLLNFIMSKKFVFR